MNLVYSVFRQTTKYLFQFIQWKFVCYQRRELLKFISAVRLDISKQFIVIQRKQNNYNNAVSVSLHCYLFNKSLCRVLLYRTCKHRHPTETQRILCSLRTAKDKKNAVFARREEDPSTRKILDGGRITFRLVFMQKFRSVWCPSRVGSRRN